MIPTATLLFQGPVACNDSKSLMLAVNASWIALKEIEKKELQIELFDFESLEITVKKAADLKI